MEDIIKKIKDHPQFIFADSDDELISIIDEVNPGLTHGQKFEIIDALEKLGRSGSRKGQDFTAQGIQTVANSFKDITTNKIPNAIGKMKENREGSSRSRRKGNSLAAMEVTRQILGDKSISDLTDDEYEEYLKEFKSRGYSEKDVPTKWDGTPFRQGSRKGGPTHDQVYDFMEFISEPYIVTDKYFDGYDKDFNDLTNDELERLFQELKQRFPVEYKEYTESLNDAYLGSRKGSGPLCDLGSVSGKGSRPGNLGSIASKVALGRKRSVNMDGEYIEQESRQGSRRMGSFDSYDIFTKVNRLLYSSVNDYVKSVYPEATPVVQLLSNGTLRLDAYPSYQRNFTNSSQYISEASFELQVSLPDIEYCKETLNMTDDEISNEIHNIAFKSMTDSNYLSSIGNAINKGLFDESTQENNSSSLLSESRLYADLRNGL